MLISLKNRSKEQELMDDPNLDPSHLKIALSDVSRVNQLLGGNTITLKAIDQKLKLNPEKKVWTIVDVGCGDGEILRRIADYYLKHSVKLRLIGVDISEKSIEQAKLISNDYPEIEFQAKNILDLQAETFSCDLIICTLTLHHFDDSQVQKVIEKCTQIASIGVIINDLHRSWIAYYLFKLFSIFFIKGHVAKNDGLVSIKRGFKRKDLQKYSKKLRLSSYKVQWKWAFRYLWEIDV